MMARRLPVVVLLAGLALAAVVVEPRSSTPLDSTPAVNAAVLTPLATSDSAGSSTWFCAGGTATGAGIAEHTVTVANPTDGAASGFLQLFVEGGADQRFPVEVPAHDQRRIVLSTLAQGEWAAALVELDHGGVVVSHEVAGIGGWDSDRCSSQASDQWYFPWGQTTPQEASSLRLALFNPFAAEAVVDITFDTEDGFRSPEALQGFLVPPRRLVTVDLTEVVPVRQRISSTIKARSGRLVVDRVQTLTGIDGTVTLDVTPGAPSAATSWYFADGRADSETLERIAVFNPSEDTALVEVEVDRPRASEQLAIEPFELQIAPQSYAEVVLNNESRVALPIRHSTVVRSLNGVAVVAERVQISGTVVAAASADPGSSPTTAPPPGTTVAAPPGTTVAAPPASGAPVLALPPGLAASMGSPVVASRWVLPNAARSDVVAAKAVITNVALDQPVILSVRAYRGGQAVELDLSLGAEQLDPRQQLELALPITAGEPLLLMVQASGPIVVDGVQTYGPLADVSFMTAIPLPEGVLVPDPLGVIGVVNQPGPVSSSPSTSAVGAQTVPAGPITSSSRVTAVTAAPTPLLTVPTSTSTSTSTTTTTTTTAPVSTSIVDGDTSLSPSSAAPAPAATSPTGGSG